MYMLDSICHFRGVGSISSFYSISDGKETFENNVDPDQTPHYVIMWRLIWDCTVCICPFYEFPRINWLKLGPIKREAT